MNAGDLNSGFEIRASQRKRKSNKLTEIGERAEWVQERILRVFRVERATNPGIQVRGPQAMLVIGTGHPRVINQLPVPVPALEPDPWRGPENNCHRRVARVSAGRQKSTRTRTRDVPITSKHPRARRVVFQELRLMLDQELNQIRIAIGADEAANLPVTPTKTMRRTGDVGERLEINSGHFEYGSLEKTKFDYAGFDSQEEQWEKY
ncbi:hypothetical protein C8R45DRAFT_930601 [Mycena sanguinolenta]|nr:hypothetical protein C8R45DRAFT_930601 [Mycena sanguinolenta]